MSFCFLKNVVLENYSVQNSPGDGGGEGVYNQLEVLIAQSFHLDSAHCPECLFL